MLRPSTTQPSSSFLPRREKRYPTSQTYTKLPYLYIRLENYVIPCKSMVVGLCLILDQKLDETPDLLVRWMGVTAGS